MTPPSRQASHGRKHVVLRSRLLLLGVLLMGVTPVTVTAFPIYQSAPVGPLGDPAGPSTAIVEDQSVGVKFHVSRPVWTGSIGGFFEPYLAGVESEILGAVVRLHGPHDFPNAFDLTTDPAPSDLLGTTRIRVADSAGDYVGNLSLRLTGGWYALVFAATDLTGTAGDTIYKHLAIMPRVRTDIGDPLYFVGTKTGSAADAFEYRDDVVGDLTGARMFLDTDGVSRLAGPSMLLLTDAASPVPEPSTLLLLGSGLAGLGGFVWRHRRG